MKTKLQVLMFLYSCVFILSGCVVRTYTVTKDRVDQDLSDGNRGYLKGQVVGKETKERKATRTTQVVEIELCSPVKFEKSPKTKPREAGPVKKAGEREVMGNRGYIMQSEPASIIAASPSIIEVRFERYTVQKGDTLQKISQKFYGTSRKWTKIYEANKEILKGPDKIYSGQVIGIPLESLKEPLENLK